MQRITNNFLWELDLIYKLQFPASEAVLVWSKGSDSP